MRYEREDWPGRAMAAIQDRICGLPEFARARSQVVSGAAEICRGLDVDGMRRLGGFSTVIRQCIDELPQQYRVVDYGSKMFPRTISDELRARVHDLVNETKGLLQREQADERIARGM